MKLRAVALAEAKAEYAVAEAMRAARVGSSVSSLATHLVADASSSSEGDTYNPVSVSPDNAIFGSEAYLSQADFNSAPGTLDVGPVTVPIAFVTDFAVSDTPVAPGAVLADKLLEQVQTESIGKAIHDRDIKEGDGILLAINPESESKSVSSAVETYTI